MRRELARNISAAAAESRGARVLDYGCGSKPYLRFFKNVASYTGVDVQVSGHDHTTSTVDVFLDGPVLPFPGAFFDIVVAFEVFEHVDDLARVLREIRRITKPGGRLIATTPFVWPEHEEPYDFRRLTSFGLNAIVVQSGYADVIVTKAGSDTRAIAQLMITFLGRVLGPTNLLASVPFMVSVVAPLNLMAILLDGAVPRTGQLYLSNVVTARADSQLRSVVGGAAVDAPAASV